MYYALEEARDLDELVSSILHIPTLLILTLNWIYVSSGIFNFSEMCFFSLWNKGVVFFKAGANVRKPNLAETCLIFIFELHRSCGHTKAQGIQHGL